MDIVIPTCGRWKTQPTLQALSAAGITPVLVVRPSELKLYAPWVEIAHIKVLPTDMNIAPTRQWIVENIGFDNSLCMLDDDLTFYIRRQDEPTKLEDISSSQLARAFADMDLALSQGGYAHVGFASREGANRNTEGIVENTRIMRVLGYRRDILRQVVARFDEMDVMEDFHVALKLLENGHKNVVLNFYAHNQAGSGKEGGCSSFRTPELHSQNAKLLAMLHSPFVKVVQKTTKGAWGGGTRDDVNIQWKKAFDHGCRIKAAKELQ